MSISQQDIKDIREALSNLSRPQKNSPYPEEIKSQAVSYARFRLSEGLPFSRIAEDIGLYSQTLKSWLDDTQRTSRDDLSGDGVFLPVRVLERSESTSLLSLVSPGGYRLCGLDLSMAADLMERLG